jgi:urease accessory protein
MMETTMRRTTLALAMLAASAGTASAHIGLGTAFTAATGFVHPLAGLDHLTAMTMVGLWAAQAGGRRLWVWPLTFVGAMLAGAALGYAGVALPLVEPTIAVSLLVLGLLVAMATRAQLTVGSAVIAVFALAHGHAHGSEAPAVGAAGYALGLVAATALLHALGICLGLGLLRISGTRIVQLLGGASAVLGIAYFAA